MFILIIKIYSTIKQSKTKVYSFAFKTFPEGLVVAQTLTELARLMDAKRQNLMQSDVYYSDLYEEGSIELIQDKALKMRRDLSISTRNISGIN